LPGWQALHEELESAGLSVVTVALDIDPGQAAPWIAKAAPTHPSLIDSTHLVNELFGLRNVPMAVWIDETGHLVRSAEAASIQRSPFVDMDIDESWPERIQQSLSEIKKMPETSAEYRAAILDWVENGAESPYALTSDEVIQRSAGRPAEHAAAAACFELGQHLHLLGNHEAAVDWWKQAHALHPDNWTYKRQAWTIETTAPGEPSDLQQIATETYGTSWLDDVIEAGGGAAYSTSPDLASE